MKNTFGIAIHGGAGTLLKENITTEQEKAHHNTLRKVLEKSQHALAKGCSAVEAVEMAVMMLEDSELYNAGKGAVFTAKGTHELDASIMSGLGKKAGAIAGVRFTKNPISLARAVMEAGNHVLLMGEGAETFADEINMERIDNKWFSTPFRWAQWQAVKGTTEVKRDHDIALQEKKFGTVGAVASDLQGNLAAATSTGGLTNKMFGRVGDSPIIGAGNYAENGFAAISATGTGESFIRNVAAYDVIAKMKYKGIGLTQAMREVLFNENEPSDVDGGLIGIDFLGNISMQFNTAGMYRGLANTHELKTFIYED